MWISTKFSKVVAFETLHRCVRISLSHHSSPKKFHRCHLHRLMAIGTLQMRVKGAVQARVDDRLVVSRDDHQHETDGQKNRSSKVFLSFLPFAEHRNTWRIEMGAATVGRRPCTTVTFPAATQVRLVGTQIIDDLGVGRSALLLHHCAVPAAKA